MKIHRFITDFQVQKGEVSVSDAEISKQIKNVLRLRVGEKIILGDGNSNEVLGVIIEAGKNVVLKVIEEKRNANESEYSVILYCSILKRENFELVAQKATEVGIKEIIPVITERTVKLDIKIDRLRKIVKEAAEQSGRGILPIVHEPIQFEEALQQTKGKLSLFFDQSGKPAKDFLGENCNVFVGPEGGWSEKEIELARNSGCEILSLGKLTLRGETAAIIASYIALKK